MPRLKRRGKGRTGYTTERHGEILETGHDFFGEFFNYDHRLQAWQSLRSEILPAFILKHPGTRPESWWRYEMPDGTRRERTDGGTHPHDDPTNDVSDRELYYGRPRYLRQCDMDAVYETETEFLRRSSLLTAAELKSLKNGDTDNGSTD